MGSFNLNCAVSGLPINDGEKIVLFFIGENRSGYSTYHHAHEPNETWGFLSMPIFCKMDDYGMSSAFGLPKEDEDFIKTLDPLSRMAFINFKKHVFFIGPDKYNYKEQDWFRASMGSNDTRHTSYFYCDPANSKQSFLNREARFMISAVRRDIYDWVMKSKASKGYDKPFIDAFNKILEFKNKWKDVKVTDENRKEFDKEWFAKPSLERSRELYGFHSEFHSVVHSLLDSDKLNDRLKTELRDVIAKQVKFVGGLYSIQKQILPNLSMCPQGGWYSSDYLKYQFAFNKFITKIPPKMAKKRNAEGFR